ncbi:MAG: sensor histidine kinase [Armatimonadetes bacterium]|nr:sensor histidine kinase [Armatimonadota bacterium]
MQIPEVAKTLCYQWQLGDLTNISQAIQALTALSKGEGQLLVWADKAFVAVLAAKNGKWEERLIGRLIEPSDEPFAFKAWKRQKIVFAPKGLLKGSEPVAHCAAFLPSRRLVLTLDIPLTETVNLSPWRFLRFPRRLLSRISYSLWRNEIPPKLLPWSLCGQADLFVWDEIGRLRWGIGKPPEIGNFPLGLTVISGIVVLRTEFGAAARLTETQTNFMKGYSLLRSEVHHRVKNDLQSIIGLLRLQARNAPAEAKTVLLDAAERIRAFATVHDLLARSKSDAINLRELAQQLAHWVAERAKGEGKNVRYAVIGSDALLAPKQASTIAAVLHELLWNACKHAFKLGGSGTITVRSEKMGNDLVIEVKDDGSGFDLAQIDGSTMGLTIVRNLVEQDLNGKLEILSSAGEGTTVRLKFPFKT